MREFLTLTGSVAGMQANGGYAGRASSIGEAPQLRVACREAYESNANEQQLIDLIEQVFQNQGCLFPRWLIVNYYVSLKTNPLVILAGAEGTGKADFARLFAAAMLGANSTQFALFPGQVVWHTATGEGEYYRSLHDRFTSLRFLELLQEAALPANIAKLYLISFQHLHPAEIEAYLTSLLHAYDGKQWRLHTPGASYENQPIIPPNVRITATVDTSDNIAGLSQAAVRHAGVIDFATPRPASTTNLGNLLPSAPGFQRLWLRTALHDTQVARQRLQELLGSEFINQLSPSPLIQPAIWEFGLPIHGRILQELTVAVANAFDEQGNGLFDRHNRLRNAQIAYDTQLIQRVRWRVRQDACPSIADYFNEGPPAYRVA